MELFYNQLTRLVTRYCGAYLPYRIRECWCKVVLSVLVSGSVVLNQISATQALALAHPAKLTSLQRHLKRVVKDQRLNWSNLYAPFIKGVVKWNPQQRAIIILDETAQTDHFRLLLAVRWYRGRAIPLAWEYWLANTKFEPGQT